MNLNTEHQIELLGLMKHWVVATQNDKTKDNNYMVVGNDSFEQQSLGNPYELVEMIEDLRSLLYEKDYQGFERYISGKGTRSEEFRYYLNLLFDDMIRQVNIRNQRKDSKYKMLYLTFVDFLEKLPKQKQYYQDNKEARQAYQVLYELGYPKEERIQGKKK